MTTNGATYQEHVHSFGEGDGLLGIATVPDTLDSSRPAVVLLNAGLVHRIGPFRLHVELARQLAAQGFLTFRIDQSALGDSAFREGGLSYEERVLLDGKETLEFLAKRYETTRYVVIGLCSGAMNAHRIALADDRVVAACLLDGYAYKVPSVWRRRLLPRLVNPKNWAFVARRLRDRLTRAPARSVASKEKQADAAPGADATEIFEQDWPPIQNVSCELDRIVTRGTRLLFVYTGGWSDYVHAEQFDEMFPGLRSRGGVRVRYFRDADHTYVLIDHRRELMDEVAKFIADLG